MDAGDQFTAAQHLHLAAVQADVEAGVLGEEHLVAGLDPAGLAADGRDDPGLADGSADAGMIRPVLVSASSSVGWITT